MCRNAYDLLGFRVVSTGFGPTKFSDELDTSSDLASRHSVRSSIVMKLPQCSGTVPVHSICSTSNSRPQTLRFERHRTRPVACIAIYYSFPYEGVGRLGGGRNPDGEDEGDEQKPSPAFRLAPSEQCRHHSAEERARPHPIEPTHAASSCQSRSPTE
jgi:hypothetical protein